MGRRKRRSRGKLIGLGLVALAIGAAYLYTTELAPAPASVAAPAGSLRVHYVDVGQGDGTIWELPDGSIAIYDCGPPAASVEESAMVRYLRDELGRPTGSQIAALISSHGHLDHIGGCEEIFAEFAVASVYEAWYEGDDAPESYRRFQREIEAEGSELHRLPGIASDTTIPLAGVRATLLWPRAFAPGGWDAIAEASLVVRLEHAGTSFCFQGDIEVQQEAQLAGRCDVYLVGHHGSRHASSAPWLARMSPRLAVVSYGDNAYGHPHPETVCRIQEAGVTLYGTPRSGGVAIASEKGELRVLKGEPEPPASCAAPEGAP